MTLVHVDDDSRSKLPPHAGHIAGLDGLRAISILLVILSHVGVRQWVPGGFGVTVFFFISGYLITTLLIAEHRVTGAVNMTRFFIRRALRLVPASLLFILLGTALMYYFGGAPRMIEPFMAIFYLANYYEIFVTFTGIPNTHLSPYNVLWSLAVEEHFYILAAPLFAFVYPYNKKVYTAVVLLALVVPLLIRLVYAFTHADSLEGQIYTFAATECRLDSIAFGVILAIFLPNAAAKRLLSTWIAISAGSILLLISFAVRDTFFRETVRYTLQGFSLLLLVPSLISGSKLKLAQAFLNNPPIVWIGQLSYSLYLFHWISLITTTLLLGASPYSIAWQVAFWVQTIFLSTISYYLVERKFLRLRARFGSTG